MGTERELLIIFIKNPIEGKVKTRLAQEIGHQKAAEIYKKLIEHTLGVANKLNKEIQLYCDELPLIYPTKTHLTYPIKLQSGTDLGMKMFNAFKENFEHGYTQIILIGSDCYDLNANVLQSSFEQLKECICTVGPARDGGYYLMGLTRLLPSLFVHKSWSTNTVLIETIETLQKERINYSLLPTLSDIDHFSDLKPYPELL